MSMFLSAIKRHSLRLGVLIAILIAANVLTPSTAFANVSRKFNAARALFDKRRYQQAERLLISIIKQYPDHRPSYYLLGRLAYRAGKSKQAARYFLRAGPSFIATGGAFEYGITMFTVKKYNLAIKGLNRVSNKSANRGIANFYIGVSYYNQKRYAQAENFLRRAHNLPQKLENSRRAFLREAERQRQYERAGRFAPQQPVYIPPPTAQNYNYQYYQTQPGGQPPPLPPGAGVPPTETAPGKVATKKPKAEPPPEPAHGFSNSITPRLEYSKASTIKDNHSYGGSESNTQGVSGGVGINMRYDQRSGTTYNLLVDVGFQNKTTTNSSFKNVVYADDPGNIIATREDIDPTLDKSATLQFKPSLELPLGKGLNLNGSFDFKMTMPEMRFAEASHTRTPAGSLEVTLGDISLEGGASMTESVDKEGNTTDQLTNLTASANKPFETITASFSFAISMVSTPAAATIGGFEQKMTIGGSLQKSWETVSLKITGTNLQNTPPSGTVVAGTHSSNTINGELSIPFEFGISFTLGGKYVLIDQYVAKLSETPEGGTEAVDVAVAATGDTQGFNGTAKFSPVDWGYISATYSHDITNYSVGRADKAEAFQQATPDLVTSTSIAIGISQSF